MVGVIPLWYCWNSDRMWIRKWWLIDCLSLSTATTIPSLLTITKHMSWLRLSIAAVCTYITCSLLKSVFVRASPFKETKIINNDPRKKEMISFVDETERPRNSFSRSNTVLRSFWLAFVRVVRVSKAAHTFSSPTSTWFHSVGHNYLSSESVIKGIQYTPFLVAAQFGFPFYC